MLPPDAPLREQVWSEKLNVSRNTLRETFRIVESQGLIDHRAHYGATVRTLTTLDVREIYAIRSTLELRGVYCSAYASNSQIEGLVEAANQLQYAARRGEWNEVGTLSLRVHRRIVQFIGSPRFDDLFSTIAAQARVAFSMADDVRQFQMPWVMRDVEICTHICNGDRQAAHRALEIYLIESEQLIRGRSVSRPAAIFNPDGNG